MNVVFLFHETKMIYIATIFKSTDYKKYGYIGVLFVFYVFNNISFVLNKYFKMVYFINCSIYSLIF